MHYFLKLIRINYISKIKTNQLPAFDKSMGCILKTWKFNKNERTGLEYWGYKFKSSKIENSFVRKALQDWNSLPCLLRKNEYKKMFKKIFNHSFEELKGDPFTQLLDCFSWKHVRFKN